MSTTQSVNWRGPLAVLLALGAAPCQALVKDIRLGTQGGPQPGSNPYFLTAASGRLLFAADDGQTGAEPWITDGSTVGTHLVKDVRPGPASSTPSGLTAFGAQFLFSADDGVHGSEPWISDGTAFGTHLFADLVPGSDGRQVSFVVTSSGFFMVALELVPNGTMVWKSDGTAAGTVYVGGFPITDGVGPRLLALGDRLLFTAGWELWISDGTSAGTFRLAVMSQTPPIFRPGFVHVLGSLALFEVDDPLLGNELWRSDGTLAGTRLVADLTPGAAGTEFGEAVVALGSLFFAGRDRTSASGGNLWRSDGTPAGTQLVKAFPAGNARDPLPLGEVNGRLLLMATDPVNGTEPWISDGTPSGTQLLMDIAPGAASSYDVGGAASPSAGVLCFAANDQVHGRELWRTDGTSAGTRLVADVEPGGGSGVLANLVAFGGLVAVETGTLAYGKELWVSDGSALGTRLLRDIRTAPPASSQPGNFVRLGNLLCFTADDGVHGSEPWQSDGTPAGTRMVVDSIAGTGTPGITEMAGLGERVVLFASLGSFRRYLIGWDGTAYGFQILPDPAGSGATPILLPSPFVREGRVAYYAWTGPSHLRSLWRTDGTVAGTTALQSNPARTLVPLFAVDGRVWFTSSTASVTELWVGDGSTAGSTLVRTFPAGTTPVSPRELTALGGLVCFLAYDQNRWDVWSSDGTNAGTLPLSDASFGTLADVMSTTSQAPHLAVWNGRLFFASRLASGQDRLWRSDGTKAGTGPVRDFQSLHEPLFTPLTTGLVFAASESASGRELWRSDGTAIGTVAVGEIQPGPGSGLADTTAITAVGAATRALLAANDGAHGIELWSTDGRTVTGHGDLAPGPASSQPGAFVRVGSQVLFLADDGTTGTELFAIAVDAFGGAFVDEVGRGCPGEGGKVPALSASGAPELGNGGFEGRLDRSRPLAPVAWLLHTTSTVVTLYGGCVSYVTLPPLVVEGVTDAGGRAGLPLPIPSVPEFVGLDVYAQALVFDPKGAWGGVLAFSNGLRVHIGR